MEEVDQDRKTFVKSGNGRPFLSVAQFLPFVHSPINNICLFVLGNGCKNKTKNIQTTLGFFRCSVCPPRIK